METLRISVNLLNDIQINFQENYGIGSKLFSFRSKQNLEGFVVN